MSGCLCQGVALRWGVAATLASVALHCATVAPANLQKCVGGFLLYKCWRIFLGIFLEDFFWALFPTKMRRKNPARKSAKKSGGSKIKIREKSVLPKAGPNNCALGGMGLANVISLFLLLLLLLLLADGAAAAAACRWCCDAGNEPQPPPPPKKLQWLKNWLKIIKTTGIPQSH